MLRWKALLAAFVSAAVVNLVGVLALLNPIAAVDSAAGPLVHPAVGLLVYVGLCVCLFELALFEAKEEATAERVA